MEQATSPVDAQLSKFTKRKIAQNRSEMSAIFATSLTRIGSSFAQLQSKPPSIQDVARTELAGPGLNKISVIALEELKSPSEKIEKSKNTQGKSARQGGGVLFNDLQSQESSRSNDRLFEREQVGTTTRPEKRSSGSSQKHSPIHDRANHKGDSNNASLPADGYGVETRTNLGIKEKGQISSVSRVSSPIAKLTSSGSLLDKARLDRTAVRTKSIYRSRKRTVPAQVSRALAQIVRQGGGTTTLRLNPNRLGRVQIEVHLKSGTANIRLHAEQRSARDLLAGHIDSLRTALEKSGVHIERLFVSEMDSNTEKINSTFDNGERDCSSSKRDCRRSRSNSGKPGSDSEESRLASRRESEGEGWNHVIDGTSGGTLGDIGIDTVA